MASHLELQDMQAQMMHCEATTSRAHHEVEDQRRAAADEVQRIINAANAERQRSSFQLDNEVKTFQKSMTEAWERQKVTLYDEFRSQKEGEQQALHQRLAETLDQQKTSLFSKFLQGEKSHDFGQCSASVSSVADAHHDERSSEGGDGASYASRLSGKQDPAPTVANNVEGSLHDGFDVPSFRTTWSKMRSASIAQFYQFFWNHGGCGRPRRGSTPSMA
jgi:hypothetical protein